MIQIEEFGAQKNCALVPNREVLYAQSEGNGRTEADRKRGRGALRLELRGRDPRAYRKERRQLHRRH